MQRPSGPPLPWVSSGWQTGYKKIPYLPVYPHFGQQVVSMIFFHILYILHIFVSLFLHISHFRQQVVSINDPRVSSQGLSIFDPRGKKASPMQRYLRYFNLCMMFDVFRGISTSTWNTWNTAEVFQLVLDISRFLQSCVDLRNGNHLFSTIIRKQAGGLAEDLNDVWFGA